MGDGERYGAAHQRFSELLAPVADDVAVPATPGWTVHALLSHVVGVASDLVTGRVDRWSQPAWTAEHVAAREGQPRDALVAEWDEYVNRVEAIIDDPGSYGLDDMFRRVPLIDVIAHEHDVREAIGETEPLGDRDWSILSVHRRGWLDEFTKAAGLSPLRVLTDRGDDWVIGGEEPEGVVRVQRQELWRSLEGRRSRAEVRGFDWSVDPEPYLSCWLGPAFAWPDVDS